MNIQVLIIIIIGSLLVCSTSKVFTITERATYSPSFNRTNRDRGKVHALFDRRTCEDILAVPLNQLSSPDKLIWKENRTHSFLVRTAYQVALRLKIPHQAEHSSVQVQGSTWRRIWKLNVPPKVRTFIWRACSNCLPTRENLHRRRVRVESICEICHQQPETNSHLLWECPFAQNVWALFKGRFFPSL